MGNSLCSCKDAKEQQQEEKKNAQIDLRRQKADSLHVSRDAPTVESPVDKNEKSLFSSPPNELAQNAKIEKTANPGSKAAPLINPGNQNAHTNSIHYESKDEGNNIKNDLHPELSVRNADPISQFNNLEFGAATSYGPMGEHTPNFNKTGFPGKKRSSKSPSPDLNTSHENSVMSKGMKKKKGFIMGVPKAINDILTRDQMNNLADDDIICEGILYRYQPGFSQQFYQKYCILTKISLNCYKNQMAGKLGETPISALPVSSIAGAEKVKVPMKNLKLPHQDAKKKLLIFETKLVDSTKKSGSGSGIRQSRSSGDRKEGEEKTSMGYATQAIKGENSSNSAMWSSREVHWHNADSQYIFAAETEIDLMKWIITLNWIVHMPTK